MLFRITFGNYVIRQMLIHNVQRLNLCWSSSVYIFLQNATSFSNYFYVFAAVAQRQSTRLACIRPEFETPALDTLGLTIDIFLKHLSQRGRP